jgi:Na+/proline symporter
LQLALFDDLGVPFAVTVLITLAFIWLYTFKGGIKTIIYADTFQTVFLISSIIICVFLISNNLDLSFSGLVQTIDESKFSKMFFFEDSADKKFFWKQFIAGIFICIAMTGLDQDLMQKNLTCKNIGEAQKNMFSFSVIFVVVNFLFQTLGALLYIYVAKEGLDIPQNSDMLFPVLALNKFGLVAGVFFLLGIIASSYASADSALASLTTSFCIDFLNFKNRKEESEKQRLKFWTHMGFSFLFFIVIITFYLLISYFKVIEDTAVVTAVFTMASFTYGPLLGLYTFGIISRRSVADRFVPIICIASPLISLFLYTFSKELFNGYQFSFEILLVNAGLTMLGLLMISKRTAKEVLA